MARVSAQVRAAQIAEQLQKTAEEQQQIGLQALKAIENGIDPEVALTVADAAIKESISVPDTYVETVGVQTYSIANPIFSEGTGIVRIRYIQGNPQDSVATTMEHYDSKHNTVVHVGLKEDCTAYVEEKYLDSLTASGIYERID